MISSVMQQGVYGMQKSYAGMTAAAQEVAKANISPPVETPAAVAKPQVSLTDALVDMRQQQHLFDASAKVVAAANHTLGSLINATA